MNAVVLEEHGDLDKLVFHSNWPVPEFSDSEVLIKVHACGLNNTDVNTRTGWYSKGVTSATTGGAFETAENQDATWGENELSFPRIQGADVAGTVVAVGRDADTSLLNKRVMIDTWLRDWNDTDNFESYGYFGSECDGGYAEYTVIDYRHVHPINSHLSNEEIATFATSWSTAENMLERAGVKNTDTVLITGASGGVGSALVQLANRRNSTTIALTSASKIAQVKSLSPDFVIDRNCDDIQSEIHSATGHDSVTVLADIVGGSQWSGFLEILSRGGRYTCSGAIAGPIVELDLRTFYLRDLSFFGCTVIKPGLFANLVGYIEKEEITPVLAAVYPLKNLRDAQREFIQKNHIGNIVVKMD